jgi:uncharacterized protein YjiS (DUF1127 family)
MSTNLNVHRIPALSLSPAHRDGFAPRLLVAMREGMRRWMVYSETVRKLRALSERQLADVGIERHNIRNIAREATR